MIYHILTFYSDAFAPIFPLLFLVFKRGFVLKGKLPIMCFFIAGIIGFGIADFLGDITGNNLFVYNLLPFIFSATLFFFFKIIFKRKLSRNISSSIFIVAMMIYIAGYKTIINSISFNSIFYIVFSITICVNCFLFYIEVLADLEDMPIWKTNHFWFVTSLFFYATASTFIWLSFKPLMDKAISINLSVEEMKSIGDLWKLHNLFFCISCITLTIAFLWKK